MCLHNSSFLFFWQLLCNVFIFKVSKLLCRCRDMFICWLSILINRLNLLFNVYNSNVIWYANLVLRWIIGVLATRKYALFAFHLIYFLKIFFTYLPLIMSIHTSTYLSWCPCRGLWQIQEMICFFTISILGSIYNLRALQYGPLPAEKWEMSSAFICILI